MTPASQPVVSSDRSGTEISFASLAAKTIALHTITYFIAGLLAFTLLDYQKRFADPTMHGYMLPTTSMWVMAGPLFQPLRGLLFACIFYVLRGSLFDAPSHWLRTWLVLAGVGIFGTFGPAPGSIEGLIYTNLPVVSQIFGLSEVVGQSLALSWSLGYWVRHPQAKGFGIAVWIAFAIAMILPILGLLAGGAHAH
jgi:hypothetical protein